MAQKMAGAKPDAGMLRRKAALERAGWSFVDVHVQDGDRAVRAEHPSHGVPSQQGVDLAAVVVAVEKWEARRAARKSGPASVAVEGPDVEGVETAEAAWQRRQKERRHAGVTEGPVAA